MTESPTISTHVLDVEHGRPAAGIDIQLYRTDDGGRRLVGSGTTDGDGRIGRLLDASLDIGDYEIEFSVGGPFFRRATLAFRVDDASRSYHVPLLVSPYALTTYRGS
jgi:5-hydroxyisourate hydrolase